MMELYMQNNRYFHRSMAMDITEPNWNPLIKVLYFLLRCIWVFCLITVPIGTILDIVLKDDIEKIADVAMNVVNILLFTSILSRGLIWITNLSEMNDLLVIINDKYRWESKAIRPITMEPGKKLAQKVLMSWMGFVIVAASFMATAPFLQKERVLPMPMWIPYNWMESPYYELTLVYQSSCLLIMVITFGNFDMFNDSFLILLSNQYKILGHSFGNVFDYSLANLGLLEEEINNFNAYPEQKLSAQGKIKFLRIIESAEFELELGRNFKNCIRHHQVLLQIAQKFQSFMSPLLLLETYCIFCYMIFLMYIVATVNDTNFNFYVAIGQYLGGSITQMYMLSYFADRFTTEVERARDSLYSIPWYLLNGRNKTDFKIVQMRMGKILRIYAGKVVPMNLETFLEFMKKTLSFFTVLRQVDQ